MRSGERTRLNKSFQQSQGIKVCVHDNLNINWGQLGTGTQALVFLSGPHPVNPCRTR